MVEEFDYLVTPNVFDCAIDIDIDLDMDMDMDNNNNGSNSNNKQGWKVERVFGSPGHEIPEKGRLAYIVSEIDLYIH